MSQRTFEHPAQLAAYVLARRATSHPEACGALYLDARHHLLATQALVAGPALDSTFDASRILRQGHRLGASRVLLFEIVTATASLISPAHRLVAIRLREAAPSAGLRLLDLVLVARDGRWVSALHGSSGQIAAREPVSERQVAGHAGPCATDGD